MTASQPAAPVQAPARRPARRAHAGLAAAVLLFVLTLVVPGGGADAREDLVASFPALTLAYRDGDGSGRLALQPRGHDSATGGARIAVLLTQNGRVFMGDGFVRPLDSRVYVTAFNVSDDSGGWHFFSGLLRRDGGRWSAAGQYRGVDGAGGARDWQAEIGPTAGPTLSTSFQLSPVEDATVWGTVGLTALLEGETRVDLSLTGLLPGEEYTIMLHAGSPAQPGASVVQVVTVVADATGNATASGLLRFRGTEHIALVDIADGDHFLSVVHAGNTLATGAIPALQPLG